MTVILTAADETAEQLLEERHAIDELRAQADQREENLQRRESLLEEIRKLAAQLDAGATPASNGGGTAPDPEAAVTGGRNGGDAPETADTPALASSTQAATVGTTDSHGVSGSAPSGDGGTKPKPAARAPRTPPSSGSKRDAVLDVIETLGEAKAADICAELNISPGAASQHLRALVGTGTIHARGATSNRVYLSAARANELKAASIDREPAAARGKTAAPKGLAPAQLRPKITDLIARNPGQLTVPLLAQGIPADEADVALMCNQLLDDKAIERTTNGAFRIVLENQWS